MDGEDEARRRQLGLLRALVAAIEARASVVEVIADSQDADEAASRLANMLGINKIHAIAILDTQFRRVTREERSRLAEEIAALEQNHGSV